MKKLGFWELVREAEKVWEKQMEDYYSAGRKADRNPVGEDEGSIAPLPEMMSSMGDVNNVSNDPMNHHQTIPSVTSSTRKKPYKSKSGLWDHFTRIKEDDRKTKNAKCNYCNVRYAYLSVYGTSALWKHVGKCPKYPGNDKGQKVQSLLNEGDNFDQELCRDALTRMIIIDNLPFNFVEREGFRYFMSVVQPKFHLSSHATVAKDCLILYASEKKKLKKVLNTFSRRVCLTIDLWTSLQNVSYMCITVHFIDRDWKLHKRILNFCVISSLKGDVIGKAVETCLLEWEIENVCTITIGNATFNDVAIGYLKEVLIRRHGCILDGEFLHMKCCAQILNLIVKESLSDVHYSISRIRGAVKYTISSPEGAQQLKKYVEQESITCKKALVLDVSTRWVSTYLMLERALKFQKAFERMEEQEQFRRELKEGAPSETDWQYARVLVEFLKFFHDISTNLSGPLCVTSNSYFHEVLSIERTISDWCKSSDPFLCYMAHKLMEKFDKYWGNIDKVNMMLLIGIILDPRYKLRYVTFCYRKVYPMAKVNELIERVKETILRVFEHYKFNESFSVGGLNSLSNSSNEMEINHLTSGASKRMKIIHHEFYKHLEEEGNVDAKTELDRYLEECVEKQDAKFEILTWWKLNSSKYAILSRMARDILAIPVSIISSESAFIKGDHVLSQMHSSIAPKVVECIICTQDWLGDSSFPIDVEENLKEIEEIESGINFKDVEMGS